MLISADVGGQKTYFTGTLHGLLGSTAEAYAAADNIKFETVTCHYIYEANGGSGAPLLCFGLHGEKKDASRQYCG